MALRAQVKSVDAIEEFRSALVLYISKGRPVLEEVGGDVLRVKVWLESNQRTYWEGQHKRRLRELEQAQQTLFSARISNLRDESAAEVMAVHRAKRQVEEAEAKLRTVKLWNRDFENRVQPLLKQIEKLHTLYSNELPKAIAHLGELVKALENYSAVPAPSSPAGGAAPPPPPSNTKSTV